MQAFGSKTEQSTSLLQRLTSRLKNPWIECLLGLGLTSWFLGDFGIEQVIQSRAGSAINTWSSNSWYMFFWNALASAVWVGCLTWLVILIVKKKKQGIKKTLV